MAHDLEFFHDYAARRLYLRWSAGNPGDSFGTILLARRGNIIRSDWESRDILVDNLAVCFGGSHGINTTNAQNVEIRNCEIKWIGGSFQEKEDRNLTRYGNAVENWGVCDGFSIHDCIVHQCYDAGLTSQFALPGDGSCREGVMRNISFCNNVMSCSNSPLELWHPDDGWRIEDCRMHGNICMYSGYHFGQQRPCKNGSFGCLGARSRGQTFVNTTLKGNFFLYVSAFAHYTRSLFMDGMECGIEADENTYLLGSDRFLMKGCSEPVNKRGEPRLYRYDRETLSALAAMGVEPHSTFYYYEGPLYPEDEAQGA